MSDDFETALDEQLDFAAEGLRGPDELDLAQDREDREAGESQKETAAEKEGAEEEERFEYVLSDGTKFEGTFDEIVAKVTEATAQPSDDLASKVKELEAKLEAATAKPAEEKAKADAESTIPAVDWSKSGSILADRLGITVSEMSDTEAKAVNEIGFLLQDGIVREVATNPMIANLFQQYARQEARAYMEEMASRSKVESAFDQFIGEKFSETEIAAFQKANPFANTREMAIMGLKMERQAKGVTEAGKKTEKAVKEAEAKSRQNTLKDLKAKGALRRLSGPSGGGQHDRGGDAAPRTETQRLNEWTRALTERSAAR